MEARGTIPANLLVTLVKPDIVIVDNRSKSVHVFELTVPGEARLDTAHKLKSDKYSHLVSDIKTHTVTVTPFEVGAQTGHINSDNKLRLHKLHGFCTKDIKLKKFRENISAISIFSTVKTRRYGQHLTISWHLLQTSEICEYSF